VTTIARELHSRDIDYGIHDRLIAPEQLGGLPGGGRLRISLASRPTASKAASSADEVGETLGAGLPVASVGVAICSLITKSVRNALQ